MLEQLFSSQIAFKILLILFTQPEDFLSTKEIIKQSGKKQVNVLRELEKLVKIKMVLKDKKHNQNFYKINKNYLYFAELQELFKKYHQETQDHFFVLNEEGGVALLSLEPFMHGYHSSLAVEQGIITHKQSIISHFKNNYAKFYFDLVAFEKASQTSLKKLLQEPKIVEEKIYPQMLSLGQRAQEIFGLLKEVNFQVENQEAVEYFQEFFQIIAKQVALNAIATFDLKDGIYTNYLKNYLQDKMLGEGQTVGTVLETLLAPPLPTLTQELRLALLKLAWQVKNGELDYSEPLKKIATDWQWLNYGYVGPVMDYGFFEDMFKDCLRKDLKQVKAEIVELENWEENINNKKEHLFKELTIGEVEQNFIRALSLLSYLKVYRKDIAFLVFYLLFQVLENLNLGWSKPELHYLTWDEMLDLVQGQLDLPKEVVRQRQRECVQIGDSNKVLLGVEMQQVANKYFKEEMFAVENTEMTALKLLEGTVASLGPTGDWVMGEVKIINSPEDMAKMNQGDILVSLATAPDIVPAMKKAGAIVTDMGGITSHAAIVSRELNKPCLIGTKYATRLFKDGDKVVVCPRHGYIKFQ